MLGSLFGSGDILSSLFQMLLMLPGIIFALSIHEWAHAFAAHKLGDDTARMMGRLTLDPTKHVDPLGIVMMILFRFGWAKPVPVNPRNFKKYRRDDTIVSLAGIVANFLTAIVAFGLYLAVMLLLPLDSQNPFALSNIVVQIFYGLYAINITLMVFNILPVPPLDGSHVFENIFCKVIPPKFFIAYKRYGFMILIAILVLPFIRNGVLTPLVNLIERGIIGFYGLFF